MDRIQYSGATIIVVGLGVIATKSCCLLPESSTLVITSSIIIDHILRILKGWSVDESILMVATGQVRVLIVAIRVAPYFACLRGN